MDFANYGETGGGPVRPHRLRRRKKWNLADQEVVTTLGFSDVEEMSLAL